MKIFRDQTLRIIRKGKLNSMIEQKFKVKFDLEPKELDYTYPILHDFDPDN